MALLILPGAPAETPRCGVSRVTADRDRVGQVRRDHSGSPVQPACSSKVIPERMAQSCVHILLEYLH